MRLFTLYFTKICLFFLFVFANKANAQVGHWRLGGNPSCPGPDCVTSTNNIFGTQPNLPIRIITNNTERLRITSFGSIQGDPSSVASAPRSFAYGLNLSVTGQNSAAFGLSNAVFGNNGFAVGNNNTVSGNNAFAGGGANTASGDQSLAYGLAVQATGTRSLAFGNNVLSSSFASFGAGSAVQATGVVSFALGENIQANGPISFALGSACEANGAFSHVHGFFSESNGIRSHARGTKMIADARGSFAMGDIDTSKPFNLVNNITQSMMIGFNSDISTLFVGRSNGAGTTGRVGIGDITAMAGGQPNNKLEINAGPADPTPSGLRLTDLTSSSSTVANPGPGVLTVDGNGDVIYVSGPTGLGGVCGTSPTALSNDHEIPLGTNNFVFSGNGSGTQGNNNVGIGIAGCTPGAKVDVLQSSGATSTIGVRSFNTDAPDPSLPSVGILATTTGSPSVGGHNIGGFFRAVNGIDPLTGQSMDHAVFVPPNSGNITIGYTLSMVPGDLQWDLAVNGDAIVTGTFSNPSDVRLKKNISMFNKGIAIIRQVDPVSFAYNGKAGLSSDNGRYIGVKGQDIASFAPYAVDTFTAPMDSTSTSATHFLAVKTKPLLYTAINAIKELDSLQEADRTQVDSLQSTVTDLEQRVTQLENIVATCCSQSMHNSSGGDDSSEQSGAGSEEKGRQNATDHSRLQQNQPNPFTQNTTIRYYLTDHVQQARLMIFNMQGRLIRTYEVEQTGWNEQVIQGGTLSAGMYYYTLTANGQEVSTRKMILTK